MIQSPTAYLKLVGAVIFSLAISGSYVLYKQNVDLQIDIANKDKMIEEANRSIETLTLARVDDQLSVINYSKKLNKIERDYRDAVQTLEKQKQKKKAIVSNPSMVTNRVNNASKRMFESISCTTGDLQRCNTNTPTTTPTSDSN